MCRYTIILPLFLIFKIILAILKHQFFHIGDDEHKYCFSIKNNSDETVGFILACLFNLSQNNPELIIQYIVLNPNYQNLGYGTEILNEIISNSCDYFSCKPHDIYANIEKENSASLNLFKKFGFKFSTAPMGYLRAHKTIKNPSWGSHICSMQST